MSWRGPQGRGYLNHQAYDPAQSFAYTSVYSGVRAVKNLSEYAVWYGTLFDTIKVRMYFVRMQYWIGT